MIGSSMAAHRPQVACSLMGCRAHLCRSAAGQPTAGGTGAAWRAHALAPGVKKLQMTRLPAAVRQSMSRGGCTGEMTGHRWHISR